MSPSSARPSLQLSDIYPRCEACQRPPFPPDFRSTTFFPSFVGVRLGFCLSSVLCPYHLRRTLRMAASMHTRRSSEASSHADSLFSQASTSTGLTAADSKPELYDYPPDEHVMLHLEYNLPIFSDDSEPSTPASTSSGTPGSPSASAHALLPPPPSSSPVPAVAAPKPRLWLNRQRRRPVSTDETPQTRALLTSLLHSHWPRSEPENPIFGRTTPRALSPMRGQRLHPHLDDDSRSSTPRPRPLSHASVPLRSSASQGATSILDSSPLVKLSTLLPDSDMPPCPPSRAIYSPASPSVPHKSHTLRPRPSVRFQPETSSAVAARPTSPSLSINTNLRPSTPTPKSLRPRPPSTQSVPRSILRSDSRLPLSDVGAKTTRKTSVKFARRSDVRSYRIPDECMIESPDGEVETYARPTWYEVREARARQGDEGINHERRRGAESHGPSAKEREQEKQREKEKESLLRRCFLWKEKAEPAKPVISGPMPLARASSLRDMRVAREAALKQQEELERLEREEARGKLRKMPPHHRDGPVAQDGGLARRSSAKRVFWTRKMSAP
ncbi:unnamed protein product [Peniophora sp. CBMAI 1063]|nr:unnamed protein product [Peniophora sp. CBMAI 1063]